MLKNNISRYILSQLYVNMLNRPAIGTIFDRIILISIRMILLLKI